jgi:spore coat protein U-like protein
VSKSKEQFELGFVVSAICVIHVVCVALLVGMTSSTAAPIAPAVVSCRTTSAPVLDFGVQNAQTPHVNKAAIIEIQCSGATPYNIGLDAETAAGATVVVRKLSPRDASANYLLYLDGERANTANNTIGTEISAETLDGVAQTHAIYARLTTETAASGNDSDTVRVTVTY